jgi:putative membrane protein
MRNLAFALAAGALALSGCTSTDGSLFGLGSRSPTETAAYMAEAAAQDAYLQQAAQVAVTKAQRPEVRAFARQLLREHSQSAERRARAADKADLAPPPVPTLGPAQLQRLAALNAAGAGFDALYLDQQIDLQAQAHRLHRNYALIGTVPDLRNYASVEDPIDYEHMMLARHLT